jgi:subtilisin family serine protease
MGQSRPAYSAVFAPGHVPAIEPTPPLDMVTAEWAWGGSTGKGIKVAVIDSGVDADHPAIGGVQGYMEIRQGAEGLTYDPTPHRDVFGHGNACAGIIRSLAPDCEIYSVKVLGAGLSGRGVVFAAGLRWAIDQGMDVCNMSLGTTKKDFFGTLHELADLAYFQNVLLVTAANNMPTPSFPSVYASVIAVAAHEEQDPYRYYYNPAPPVEFGALGINARVAWREGSYVTVTGNSFAAPHIAGLVAKIRAKHPALTPFQMKAVLRASAANVSGEAGQISAGPEDACAGR